MASYTTPVIHATDDVLAVTDYNSVANNTVFNYQTPYFNYYNSVGTSLTNGTATQLSLGGTTASNYGFVVSSNNVIAPLTGTYAISFSAGQNSAATSGAFWSSLLHNGTEVARGTMMTNNASGLGWASSGGTVIIASAGDTFGLWAFQSSGGANASQNAAAISFISGFFVGSQ